MDKAIRKSLFHRQSNKSNLGFNQMSDFISNFFKVFNFNDAEFLDDFVLVNCEKFVRLDDGAFR